MEFDDKEVERHLEALGFENIDPLMLQTFIKDLKKLIIYERKKKKKDTISQMETNEYKIEEKIQKQIINCNCTCCTLKNQDVFDRLSFPITKNKICPKSLSSVGVQTDPCLKKIKNDEYSHSSKTRPMDPVSLYQFYQSEWHNHKVPGEKSHDQLRWNVRQMMKRK
ncbi:centriolar and ciliogenesis-associated protein hyls-1-like [Daktulosphaira vitifoliae]|uniref:centriolar and ciliogenesis-associated protein hyls-1-like n=1 Tax=Daktulosphaira vitifoliae TaxID=58002 RepID=UPI0021AA2217|nr:centriolar and ciliogenesis-associated protein hyls-1-like [Daktulosphaira vitifoliae]